jgi:hypothetical protein
MNELSNENLREYILNGGDKLKEVHIFDEEEAKKYLEEYYKKLPPVENVGQHEYTEWEEIKIHNLNQNISLPLFDEAYQVLSEYVDPKQKRYLDPAKTGTLVDQLGICDESKSIRIGSHFRIAGQNSKHHHDFSGPHQSKVISIRK